MLNNVQEFLDDFKDYVIKQAKSNLTRMKKNSSKKLYNSLSEVMGIKMEDVL